MTDSPTRLDAATCMTATMSCCAKAEASAALSMRSPTTSEPVTKLRGPCKKIVKNARMRTPRRQPLPLRRADIARAAGHQNGRTIVHVSLAIAQVLSFIAYQTQQYRVETTRKRQSAS